MTSPVLAPPLRPVAAQRGGAAEGCLRELDGRLVAWFRLAGGEHRGAIGTTEGEVVERTIAAGVESGVPVVGVLATSGADVSEGVASLHAWGRVARALQQASGVVPVLLAVTGPCVSGPALLLGLADVVVFTAESFAYVSGPEAVAGFTGVHIRHHDLGGSVAHSALSGVASLVADDEDDAVLHLADVLAHLPSNNLEDPPLRATSDPLDRRCSRAASVVPQVATASYDVRDVIADVVDDGDFLELKARYASNVVTGFGWLGGRSVGIIANQPCQRAGTLDIEASQKAARFVQWCDAFDLPLVTLVDTPGFQPGKDLEWRGMIRHGAQLVAAYAAATVPRLCVVLRKAYGGAYIVMDSKTLGNDVCVAWPRAEVAVMGAAGAVQILHGRRLRESTDPDVERFRLEREYAEQHCTPVRAAARGFVDDVIDPADTRRVLTDALRTLGAKRDRPVRRRHANTPL